ncbi:MAG: chorismate-binding protein, partial [Actinobacteria bacterium]|nr:chorismate-binding protein [Actinomycetota bacterium]
PPGSVTGAPKSSALRLIAELEDARRGVFTGAIGYLGPGRAEFNVAIRTFEISGDRLELGVGGGITAGSVPVQEWQECLVKAAPLLELGGAAVADDAPLPPPAEVRAEHGVIETMLAVDGRLVALADHLDRLAASCAELYRLRLPDELPALLAKAVVGTAGRHRVRLRWGPGMHQPEIEVTPAGAASGSLALYRHPGRTGSWRHKWADRDWLAAQERPGSLPLFTTAGEDGTELALETSRGNLAVVGPDGTLRSPELGEAVLPGTTRRRLLDAAFDRGRPVVLGPVRLTELATARLVLSLSSIAGVVAVSSLDGRPLAVDRPLLAELAGWLA